MKSSFRILCVIRLIGRSFILFSFIAMLGLGMSVAQAVPLATTEVYVQAGRSTSDNAYDSGPFAGPLSMITAKDEDSFSTTYGPSSWKAESVGNTSFNTVFADAQVTATGFNAYAWASAVSSARTYFNVKLTGLPPWFPQYIPTFFSAAGQAEVSQGFGRYSITASVSGDPNFPAGRFRRLRDYGGVYQDSFSDGVTMYLPPNNPDNPYVINLSALVIAFAATAGPSFETYDSVVSASVDPIIRFDQEAFDAICAQQGEECFSLSDYYKLEFSPNLVVNRPPVLNPIGNQQANEGQLLQFIITASDPDEDTLTYEASNLPAGATFDAATQTFQWTPGYDQAGSYQNVLFKVTDSGTPMASASEAITITVGNVNRPPVLDPIGSKTVKEGQLLTIIVTANDPDGDTLTYSASNLPSGASFDPSTRTFIWIPGYDQAGNYPEVRFTVADNGIPPASTSEAITITVGNVNRPPVLAPVGDRIGTEGELLQFTITATDPDGDALTYSASDLPDGAAFDPVAQKFSWTPGFDQAGSYPNIELTVIDNGDPIESDTELITITVGNVNRAPVFAPVGTQQVFENQLLQFSVMATDYDGDGITYSTSPLPNGASFDASNRLFSWTPDSSQTGTYVVAFYATDNGSPPMTDQLDVVITVGYVATPCQLADQIVQTVLSLNLPKSVENSYMANLKKVCRFVEEGKITPAINQLNAFINKVRTDITNGNITGVAGNNLINMATNLINTISI